MEVFDKELFAAEFIEQYSNRGFGSMNKNDFEVLIFNLLRKYGDLKNKTNFEMSLDLQIPETKVRRLAYESDLKYTHMTESDIKEAFFVIVAKSKLRGDLNKIEFVIENKFIRSSIGAQLKQLGHYADSSFNSEIVRIHIESFIDLLAYYYPEKAIERIVKECKTAIKLEKGEAITFKLILRKFLEGLATQSGKKVVDLGTAYFTGGAENIGPLVENLKGYFS
ncbi:hypothetical protein KDU71_03675 [Carboxylicivirga sediminis]|uniref:Uncharacterized protein n=1 Tax=Carboxylicivirga sediminis TaxID=2006564 RepID=A0A941F1E9_9BACT|nr:hypothetical protein [Carboxylicivirga sediminis]MBR8534647.1 hypothetical protein [Carboxylicivirga sediminis]